MRSMSDTPRGRLTLTTAITEEKQGKNTVVREKVIYTEKKYVIKCLPVIPILQSIS